MFGSKPLWKRTLVIALVALMALSPGAGAKDGQDGKKDQDKEGPWSKPTDQTTVGHILAPTHEATRLFSPMSTRGVTHYLVHATPDAEFLLASTETSHIRSCTLGVCVQTGDFDVTFFHDNGDGTTTVTGRFNSVGMEVGIVPPNTSFGFVYLKTPGMDPRVKGFEFFFTEIHE